jgi:nitrogen fixation protein FixH
MSQNARDGEFTGRHMLAIMSGFFAVIIGVNVTMAMVAGSSWSGLVVRNSYVASQEFNAHAERGRAQAALGWSATFLVVDGTIRFALTDRDGGAVPLSGGSIALRRPVGDADDRTLAMAPGYGGLVAQASLADGVWIAEIVAQTGRSAPYRDVRRFIVSGGSLR